MADPTQPAATIGRMGSRTTAEEHARRDELLERIEAERLVSAWCWPRMIETVGHLTDLGDDLAWVVTAYLACVAVRGDRMFSRSAEQMELGPVTVTRRTLACRCGEAVETDQPITRGGRQVVTAVCDACGLVLVEFDGEPYTRPTLISAAMR